MIGIPLPTIMSRNYFSRVRALRRSSACRRWSMRGVRFWRCLGNYDHHWAPASAACTASCVAALSAGPLYLPEKPRISVLMPWFEANHFEAT